MGFPKGTIDLLDITNFRNDEFFSRRVDAYMKTREYQEKLDELGWRPVEAGTEPETVDNEVFGANFRKSLLEFVQKQSASELLIGRDAFMMRAIAEDIIPEDISRVLEEEFLNCQNSSDYKGYYKVMNAIGLPPPLGMEISFLLFKPANVPYYAHKDLMVDRSFLQARKAQEIMREKNAKQGSLYVGIGHMSQVTWFLQNLTYDLRDSLTRAQGALQTFS